MNMDSFSPRKRYVPLRCEHDVLLSAPAQPISNSPRRLMPSVHRSPWFYGKDFHARRVVVDVKAGK
jgi:hypothetical protein